MTNSPMPLELNDALVHDIKTAVIRSIGETFAIQVEPGEVEYGTGIVSLVGDISGIIGIVQAQLDGTLMLSMTAETVREILPKVLGNAVAVTPEMEIDTVSELTNMIFGQVKSELNQRGLQIKLGIPCVVTGKGHFVSQFHRGRYMIVPFQISGRLFQVYIAVHNLKKTD